jgi:hypothetical protein
MKTSFKRVLLTTALIGLTALLHAEPTLVGNKSFAGQTLDADGIKAVLLGKKVMLGDTRVVIVVAKSGAGQDAFLQAHAGMTTSQFQNYWRRLFMTGGGTAPKIVETEAEALKLTAETTGAVSIAEASNAGALVVLSK